MKTAHLAVSMIAFAAVTVVTACSSDPTQVTQSPEKESEIDAGSVAVVDASLADAAIERDVSVPAKDIEVTLTEGKFENGLATGGSNRGNPYYKFSFLLRNLSNEVVGSMNQLELDFGNTMTVKVNDELCDMGVELAPGKERTLRGTLLVNNKGISGFDIVCGGTQKFLGASGSAPLSSTFAGPIRVSVRGVSKEMNRFEAKGNAIRSNP
jgi:hypothetical protein